MSAILQQSGLITAIGFRLLLILSLWQGPVVWGHYHSENGLSLAEHLARFHQGDVNAECGHWHWHVSFAQRGPADEGDTTPPGHPVIPQDLVSPVLVAPIGVVAIAASVEACDTLPLAVRLVLSHFDRYAVSGFLSSFCPTHSAQEVLCRRLC